MYDQRGCSALLAEVCSLALAYGVDVDSPRRGMAAEAIEVGAAKERQAEQETVLAAREGIIEAMGEGGRTETIHLAGSFFSFGRLSEVKMERIRHAALVRIGIAWHIDKQLPLIQFIGNNFL